MADGKTIVRGADGNLYWLSMTDPPEPLAVDLAQRIEAVLPEIEGRLEELFAGDHSVVEARCSQYIKIVIPDVPILP